MLHLVRLVVSAFREAPSLTPQVERRPSQDAGKYSGPKSSRRHAFPYPLIGFGLGLLIGGLIELREKNKKKLDRNNRDSKG
ncbi:MAG TPA: hypothetical protein VHZ29_03500 [Rhizomicrobium sp.]|nr:hypothetical protein [Rhizomicrobium sp.]